MPPAFSPTPTAPPPGTATAPGQQPATPSTGAGFDASALGGGAPEEPSFLEQNAGIFEQLRMLSFALTQGSMMMQAIAAQFPAAVGPVRDCMQALDQSNQCLLDIMTTIMAQSQEPGIQAPAVLG